MADKLFVIGFWTIAAAIAVYAVAAFFYVLTSFDGTIREPYVLAAAIVVGFLGGLLMAISAFMRFCDNERRHK